MTTLAKTGVGALDGSFCVGESPRPSNPDPVKDKRLFVFKEIWECPPPPPGTKTKPNETLKRLKLQ